MTTKTKLFRLEGDRAWPFPAYAVPGDAADPTRGAVGQRRLGKEWSPLHLRWQHAANRRKAMTPQVAEYLGFPCLRACDAERLAIPWGEHLEPLPAVIEGSDWLIVNATYHVDDFDVDTSCPLWTPSGPESHPIRFDWINTTDRQVLELEVAAAGRPRGTVLLTQSLADRIKLHGLAGVRLRHCGFVVSDYAYAMPAPVRRDVVSHTSSWLAQPLDPSALARLAAVGQRAHKRMGLTSASNHAEVLRQLEIEAGRWRGAWAGLHEDDRVDLTDGLGWVYGELLMRELGWHWAALRKGAAGPWPVVAASDERHALLVQKFAESQITGRQSTWRLMFNMLREGRLPPLPRNGVAVLQ